MGVLGIILLVVFVIVSLLLIFLVVIQDEDSDSLGGIFAGGSQSAFGSRSSNVIIRITYVLGALFFVTAFGLALVNRSSIGNVEAKAATEESQVSGEWWKTQDANSTTTTILQSGDSGTTTTLQPATSVTTVTTVPVKN